MSAPRPGGRAYAALLRLYPRAFRDEYGADMVQLFADQRLDEPAARVWARALVDLAITVPPRRLEVIVNRPPSSATAVFFLVLTVAGLVVAIVGGTSVAMAAIGLGVAVVCGGLTTKAWRTSRPVAARGELTARWWRFVAGGALAIAAIAVVTTITGELPEGWWVPTMLALLASVLTVATGLVLGLAHLANGRSPRHP